MKKFLLTAALLGSAGALVACNDGYEDVAEERQELIEERQELGNEGIGGGGFEQQQQNQGLNEPGQGGGAMDGVFGGEENRNIDQRNNQEGLWDENEQGVFESQEQNVE